MAGATGQTVHYPSKLGTPTKMRTVSHLMQDVTALACNRHTEAPIVRGMPVAPVATDADKVGPLHVPATWSNARQPESRPPSPIKQPQPPKRMAGAVVESVLKACRRVDPGSTLASATYTQEGHTLVRIRSGASGSVTMIQRGLQRALPLATTDVTDSALDGTCEAAVTVPVGRDENNVAWAMASAKLMPKVLFNVGVLLLVAGVGAWVSEALQGVAGDPREL